MRRLFMVQQAVIGSSRTAQYYFATKKEAEKFYDEHDYVDMPKIMKKNDAEAIELLKHTEATLAMLECGF